MQYFHLKDRSPDSLARPIVRILYGSLLLLASMLLSGCSEEQITKTTYSVPKPVLDDLNKKAALIERSRKAAELRRAEQERNSLPQRMLAAYLSDMKGKKFWSAKLVGEPDVAAKVVDDFNSFIKSWSFSEKEDELPKWTLPKGWAVKDSNEGPGTVAKVNLEVDGVPLSIKISKFGIPGDAALGLSNINRWRNELSLKPLEQEDLEKETTVVQVGGEKAYIMNEVGKFRGGMSAAGRLPPGHPTPTKSDDAKKSASDAPSEKKSESKKFDTKESSDTSSESKGK